MLFLWRVLVETISEESQVKKSLKETRNIEYQSCPRDIQPRDLKWDLTYNTELLDKKTVCPFETPFN